MIAYFHAVRCVKRISGNTQDTGDGGGNCNSQCTCNCFLYMTT